MVHIYFPILRASKRAFKFKTLKMKYERKVIETRVNLTAVKHKPAEHAAQLCYQATFQDEQAGKFHLST